MKTIHAMCALLCLGSSLLHASELKVGSQWPELRTTRGKVFWNVKFTFVSPREVRFMHTAGVSSMPLTELALGEDVTVIASSAPVGSGSLGAMMTPEERKNSGIDKLTADEQAALAKWVQHEVGDLLKEAMDRAADQTANIRLGATVPPGGLASVTTPVPGAPPPTDPSIPEPVVDVAPRSTQPVAAAAQAAGVPVGAGPGTLVAATPTAVPVPAAAPVVTSPAGPAAVISPAPKPPLLPPAPVPAPVAQAER